MRSYHLATIGDFATWRGVTRQAAHLYTKQPWFPPPLTRISNQKMPVWAAYHAATALLDHNLPLPHLPPHVLRDHITKFPPLCGVAEIGDMIGMGWSGAARITLKDWFPQPLDTISTQGEYPVWDARLVQEALENDGGYTLTHN